MRKAPGSTRGATIHGGEERDAAGSRPWFSLAMGGIAAGILIGCLRRRSDAAEESTFGDAREQLHEEATIRESEVLFRAIFEEAGIGIALVDLDGRILRANRSLARMLGYRADELHGRHFSEITLPEHVDRDQALYQELIRGERERYQIEKCYVRSDGQVVWGRLTVSIVAADGGVPRYALGMVEDVTERRLAQVERDRLIDRERAAREAAERRIREETALREAARAVSASFTIEDITSQIVEGALRATEADGAYIERIHAARGEVEVSAAAGSRTPPVGAVASYAGSLTERALQRREPEHIERLGDSSYPLPDHLARTCTDCSAVVIPLFDTGNAIGALFVLRAPERPPFRADEIQRAFTFGDLASLSFRKVHLYEEAERRREDLEHVSESRARLMRGFSHDVKNPLGAADGYLELFEDGILGEVTDKQRESIGRVRSSVRAALALIEDLVALAKAEAGHIEINKLSTSVARAAREVAEEYRAEAETKGLILDVDVTTEAEAEVIESDPGRIRQVLGNLMSNAIKYTDDGRVRVSVEERQGDRAPGPGRWMAVGVSDTGPGIPTEKQRFLFQEFSRLDPGTKAGAGLGLAISQRVAEALGGKITYDGEAGTGASFTLWLPIARPEA